MKSKNFLHRLNTLIENVKISIKLAYENKLMWDAIPGYLNYYEDIQVVYYNQLNRLYKIKALASKGIDYQSLVNLIEDNHPVKSLIINSECWESIRIEMSRDKQNIAFPTIPLDICGVNVFGSSQVHKGDFIAL